MNLILLEPGEVDDEGLVRLSDARGQHVLQTLKATPGQTVRVGLCDGPHGTGTITSAGNGIVSLRCVFEPGVPQTPRMDLLLALPRPKVLRRLWAQMAAMGVGHVMLTNAARVERNYFDTHVLTPACYRPLLIEGLQQARETRLPRVSIHRQFKVLVEDELDRLHPDGVRLVAHPGGRSVMPHGAERVLLAIGPEGGWNAFELALLEAHGFRHIGMGPRTLRTDTACIALLAIVHEAIDETIRG